MQRILILCTGNSARSQMAEGLLRHIAGDRLVVHSAGTKPAAVRPEAVAAMKEIGIDISSNRSKHVDEFRNDAFDYVLAVCDRARESCPVYIGHANRLHHNLRILRQFKAPRKHGSRLSGESGTRSGTISWSWWRTCGELVFAMSPQV